MRSILRVLSGGLGMVAGWWVTGMIAINMIYPRNLSTVFLAFVEIGSIGCIVGCVGSVWVFNRWIDISRPAPSPTPPALDEPPQ